MKLSPSACLIKLISHFLLVSPRERSDLVGKVLLGSLLVFSLIISISQFQTLSHSLITDVSAQSGTEPLFGNPISDDFLSYAVAIMPTVPGANLNTSNIAGST